MSVQWPRTPLNQTLESPNTTTGIASSSDLNDLRRYTIAQWLVDDVSKTASASALAMLAVFTQRIMPFDSKEHPKDVLERILNEVRSICRVTNANPEGTSSTRKRTKRQNVNKRKGSGKSTNPVAMKVERMVQAQKEFHKKCVESETYVPFVTLTNTALDLLKTAQVEGTIPRNATFDILLQHNDPSLLYYKFNSEINRRKPDNIFVILHTARVLHNDRTATWEDIVTKYANAAQQKADKGQPYPRLDWGDALCSIEHERTGPIARQSPGKLKESSLSPLVDLNRFFPKRCYQRDTIPSGPKRKMTRQGDFVQTTGSSHAAAESSVASQVQMPLQNDHQDWEGSVAIQSAEYGLGRLCCSYDILHAFTLIVVDGVLHVSWYDHEGIITTNGFSLSKHFDHYLALLFIFQRFDGSAWGRCGDTSLQNNRQADGIKESTVSIDGKVFSFDPTKDDNVLRKPFGIGGRATTVYACRGIGEQEPGHVIKFNWKEESMLSEWKILNKIRRRVQQDEEAGYIARISKTFQRLVGSTLDESDSLLSYLPKAVAGVETDISTKTIRKSLGLETQPRQLVVIVFVKLDGIICRLNGEEYWQVFWDCFRCHKRLWKLGIYHRDISNGNMMFYRKNGHLFGVLIDFDLASVVGVPSQNQRRTGTRPFMAYRLLTGGAPVRHVYKYDAESFFWVAVYDSASQSSVHGWGNLDNSTLAAQKLTYFVQGIAAIPIATKWENSRPISHWLDQTRKHFLSDTISSTNKDWGVDELYNMLRRFREDRGIALLEHIKTRQAKCIAGGTQ